MTMTYDTSTTGQANRRIAVLGAGAVGCYFGGMLARAGHEVVLIGRPAHMAAVERDGLHMQTAHFDEHVRVHTAMDASAAHAAQLVLFCVKSTDTDAAARSLAPHIAADTPVLSLQNGVDNAARIRAATHLRAIPTVVYVAAMMTAPGTVRHTGRGDLVIAGGPTDVLSGIAALFSDAGVPCRISDDIDAELWSKLIMNCAYNAISAVTGARYGDIRRDAAAQLVMRDAIDEVLAVAAAAGVRMEEGDYYEAALRLGDAMPQALSSTAQDLQRGKPTEIDALNGYVARRAAEVGLRAPVNHALTALVHLAEQQGARSS